MTHQAASEYEDYGSTSKNYDASRVFLGVKILLGTFVQHPEKALGEQRLLDAGCGTGSFLCEIAGKFATATGLDASTGMLGQAKEKLGNFANVMLKEGNLPDLSMFPDGSFDAMMIHQVVHHLDNDPGFPVLRDLIDEAFRVLAPGGALVLHTSSQEQVRKCYWFGWVVPEAREKMASRYAPIPEIREMFGTAGFEDLRITAPLEAMYHLDVYLDPEGPFREEWRACDSMFALATGEELEQGLRRLRAACDDGSVRGVIDEAEEWRQRSGQSTFLSARKPLC
jgi:ubiquinone/menaquinone biosynthesis C-methylase UbiE